MDIKAITEAYEAERGQWDNPPPAHCDAIYFRLRRLVTLEAPDCIIEYEKEFLQRKITLMRKMRGVILH